MSKIDTTPKVLGLDISTKTIGWALFDIKTQELLELTHFSPKVKPKAESKIAEMMAKVKQKSIKKLFIKEKRRKIIHQKEIKKIKVMQVLLKETKML